MKILQVSNISKSFLTKEKKEKMALKNMSFDLEYGEFLAVVGESGSGKSTLAKIISQLHKPDQGEILFEGRDLSTLNNWDHNQRIQMILQNPYSSFDPLASIKVSLEEVLYANHLVSNQEQAMRLLEDAFKQYNLPFNEITKKGNEFSGGQLQRLGILRAMLLQPKLLIADEIISALDVNLKVQILDLLKEIQKKNHLSILFITHNLSSIQNYADRILVMFQGECVEIGTTEQILFHPQHPYTKKLIGSIPFLSDKK